MHPNRQTGTSQGPSQWFQVQAIGTVRRADGGATDAATFFDPWQESVLEIEPRWADGLLGIEQYSHLVVLFWLDRAEPRRAAESHRAAEDRVEATEIGFFGTRTPRRPNPIGIACPRLLRRDEHRLFVRGIDAWDGTPLLDLKGYAPRDELRPDARVPAWLTELWQQHDKEGHGPPEGS